MAAKESAKVWFIADTHFRHSNILKYSDRSKLGDTIERHDESLIKLWNLRIAKHDTVYILGDFAFTNINDTKTLLRRLNGKKILIKGNHDKTSDDLLGYFQQITLIKNMKFKQSVYPFLNEDFEVSMCHFPILSWKNKARGSVMVHGHCHGRLDEFNNQSKELRVDVGFDGEFANNDIISLGKLYKHFTKIANGKSLKEYAHETLDVTTTRR